MKIIENLNIKEDGLISLKDELDELKKAEENQFILPSGSNHFDNLLANGFRSNTTFVIFGGNKTGKTQLCHQLCIQACKNITNIDSRKNFSKSMVYYFDLENTFRPERLQEIATYQGLEMNEFLPNIKVSKIASNSALLLKLKEIEQLPETKKVLILIIDSINKYYRLEIGDKEASFTKVKSTFINILEKINQITKKFDLITILTAQIAPNFSATPSMITELPVGNSFLTHFFSEFLYLSIKEEKNNYVHLVNSIQLPEKRFLYKITSKGIEDYKIL